MPEKSMTWWIVKKGMRNTNPRNWIKIEPNSNKNMPRKSEFGAYFHIKVFKLSLILTVLEIPMLYFSINKQILVSDLQLSADWHSQRKCMTFWKISALWFLVFKTWGKKLQVPWSFPIDKISICNNNLWSNIALHTFKNKQYIFTQRKWNRDNPLGHQEKIRPWHHKGNS